VLLPSAAARGWICLQFRGVKVAMQPLVNDEPMQVFPRVLSCATTTPSHRRPWQTEESNWQVPTPTLATQVAAPWQVIAWPKAWKFWPSMGLKLHASGSHWLPFQQPLARDLASARLRANLLRSRRVGTGTMLSRRRLLAGLSCLPFGCGAEERHETLRPPTTAASPPWDPMTWREALGPLDDVAPELRAAFTDPRGFDPMPPVRAGDWRSVRPEAPQSVSEFLGSSPNFRAAPRERLVLLPLGRFPFDVVIGTDCVGLVRTPEPGAIASLVSAFFATPTDVLPACPHPETGLPWREVQGHRQHDARALLAAVAPRVPRDAYGMLTLANVDLFVEPEQQFAFGWSTFNERLAVIGFTRFDPSFFGGPAPTDLAGTVLRRSMRVAVHEVGHLFGLAHCQAFRCAMNGIADLDELDAIPLRVCPLCLRKLHLVTGLDLAARDAALMRAFAALSLPEEALWVAERSRLRGA